MFDDLTGRLGGIFDKLTKRGALKEADVEEAMREIRVALLEADVALPVVKYFIAEVTQRATGEELLRSVTPGQMVVKAVHDHLVKILDSDDGALNFAGTPPVAILMVGLQGSGKTTTSAKLGLRLRKKENKKVLMASLDVMRPAAQQQLTQLGEEMPLPRAEQPVRPVRLVIGTGRLINVQVAFYRGKIPMSMPMQARGRPQGITHQREIPQAEMVNQIFHVLHVIVEHVRLVETGRSGTASTAQIGNHKLETAQKGEHEGKPVTALHPQAMQHQHRLTSAQQTHAQRGTIPGRK